MQVAVCTALAFIVNASTDKDALESKVVYEDETVKDQEESADVEKEYGRAAIWGHFSQAANPHQGTYPPPPLPPFLHHPAALPPPYQDHHNYGYEDEHKYGYEDDHKHGYDNDHKYGHNDLKNEYDYHKYEHDDHEYEHDDHKYGHDDDTNHHYTAYDKPDVYDDKEEDHYDDHQSSSYEDSSYDSGQYDDLIEYVKPAISKGIRQLEKLLETLHLVKDLVNDAPKHKCPKPDYVSGHKKACDPKKWSKCNCLSPPTYTDDGRGNCNLGAIKTETKVWCYVENKYGDPQKVCPDSKPSKSKPGYYWSRFACITG